VLRRAKMALLMTRAQSRLGRQEYDLAMDDVRRIYEVLGEFPGSENAPAHLNILASLAALRTAAYKLSVECAATAIVQLRGGRGRWSRPERAHLDRYACIVGQRAAYLGGLAFPWELAGAKDEAISGKVSSYVRHAFPL
jgi:hypothetical protein